MVSVQRETGPDSGNLTHVGKEALSVSELPTWVTEERVDGGLFT